MIWVGVGTLCVMAVGVFFGKEIRIAYHRNRMFTAVEYCGLLRWRPTRPATKLEGLRIILFRMSEHKESEVALQHQEALLKLGYLEKREFWLTNRVCINTDSNLWAALLPEVNKTFADSHWRSFYFPETNRFEVTATPADMPKWEKLISDFDR